MSILRKNVVAVFTLSLMAIAFVAPAAVAQTGEGYNQEGPAIVDELNNGEPAAPASSGNNPVRASSGNELPFTGLDIGILAAAGASLLLLGFGMRHLTRAPDSV